MFRCVLVISALVCSVTTLAAKPPVPLRLVSFDATVRKVGKTDAQQVTLALVEGRKTGKTYAVYLAPSQKTAGLVGRQLYLRLPLAWLAKKDLVFFAGELLDLDPAWVPPDFFTSVPFKEGTAERYVAGRVGLDGVNEVNGTFLPTLDPAQWIKAAEAIATAEKVYPDGMQGTFVFTVRGTGEANGGVLWLNSETDYHNPQSLNASMPLSAVQDLELRLKADPIDFLKGKTVVVSGIAHRVKITTLKKGEFYFQTQVQLWSAHQIRVVP